MRYTFGMQLWQYYFLISFLVLNICVFLFGLWQSAKHKNAYGQTPFLWPLGIFVWGDATIFGLFWALVSLFCIIAKGWLLFGLIYSVFWAVRSFGEMHYWLNQQFSQIKREKLEDHPILFSVYRNNSIWFIFQIFHQCILVISIVCAIYISSLWLS